MFVINTFYLIMFYTEIFQRVTLNFRSFGVALWELTMFGELPYPELSNGDVLDLVIIEQSCKLPHPTIPLNKLDNL